MTTHCHMLKDCYTGLYIRDDLNYEHNYRNMGINVTFPFATCADRCYSMLFKERGRLTNLIKS